MTFNELLLRIRKAREILPHDAPFEVVLPEREFSRVLGSVAIDQRHYVRHSRDTDQTELHIHGTRVSYR